MQHLCAGHQAGGASIKQMCVEFICVPRGKRQTGLVCVSICETCLVGPAHAETFPSGTHQTLSHQQFAERMPLCLFAAQVQRHINGDMWAVGDLVSLVVFVVVDVFVGISVAALAISQASQLGRNVTTNELTNWHR